MPLFAFFPPITLRSFRAKLIMWKMTNGTKKKKLNKKHKIVVFIEGNAILVYFIVTSSLLLVTWAKVLGPLCSALLRHLPVVVSYDRLRMYNIKRQFSGKDATRIFFIKEFKYKAHPQWMNNYSLIV